MGARPLTKTEVKCIQLQFTNPRDRALFILGVRTGFRISELLSLRVMDVVGKDTVTVQRRNMKGKARSRTVPLHTEAKKALDAYLKCTSLTPEAPLFPMCRMTAHRIMKRAATQLRGQISTHSMRKTFGQRVYELSGKDVVAAQRALGHASLSSTTAYLSIGQDLVDKLILAE